MRMPERISKIRQVSYLLTLADSMTAVLVFFLVFTTLARDQTGANLYAGTGSFVRATDQFGLQGRRLADLLTSPRGSRSEPLYVVDSDLDPRNESETVGPDPADDGARVIDREQESFVRFLQELRRFHGLRAERRISGEATFDVLGRLPETGAPMLPEIRELLSGLGPVLRNSAYEVELTVWATTPSQSAWLRAAHQSVELRRLAIEELSAHGAAQPRLTAVARTWMAARLERPALSLTVRRLSD